MKWMRERDLLIAQTMAFVQSVTGRKPDAEMFARPDLPAVIPTRLPDVEAGRGPWLIGERHRLGPALGIDQPAAEGDRAGRDARLGVRPGPLKGHGGR